MQLQGLGALGLAAIACAPFDAPRPLSTAGALPEDIKRFEAIKTNTELAQELRSRLEITSASTRGTFGKNITTKALLYPSWMIGATIYYTNDENERVSLLIDERGEIKPNRQVRFKVSYPDKERPLGETIAFKNNRYLAVYGSAETISRIKAQKDQIEPFIQEYFKEVPYPLFCIYHLLTLPPM